MKLFYESFLLAVQDVLELTVLKLSFHPALHEGSSFIGLDVATPLLLRSVHSLLEGLLAEKTDG